MSYSHIQKIAGKQKLVNGAKSDVKSENTVLNLINGINELIARANTSDMGTAARILHMAREELVHWAVDMNFHETAEERFINSQLYSNTVTNARMLQSFVEVLEQSVHMLDGYSVRQRKIHHGRRGARTG